MTGTARTGAQISKVPMIGALMAIGGPESASRMRGFLMIAAVNGFTQGLALAALVPLLVDLLQGDWTRAWTWLAVLAGACAINGIFVVASTRCGFTVSMGVIGDMHRRLSEHMVRLPLSWFDSTASARASNIVVRGTMFVSQTAMDVMVPVVTAVTTPIAVALVALVVDWRIGLVLLLSMLLILLVTRWGSTRNSRAERIVHHAALETDRRLLEFADDQVTLRSSGVLGSGYQPLARAIDARRRAGRRALWSSVVGMIAQSLVLNLLFGLVVALAVHEGISGRADPVAMVALIALSTQVVAPLRVLAELTTALRRARIELDEVSDVLSQPEMPSPERSGAQPVDNAIELSHVSFGYEGGDKVLDDLTLNLPAGRTTALVGASGSGKTTVTRLIARFWDVDSGSIRIGGVDLRDLSEEDRMAQLSLVFQDVYLFDESLRANVALGDPDAGPQDVERAAELAQVRPIAARLAQGWDTPVGEGGRLLSGGERQRVSIARALLKGAPILLLDEATAALDPVTAKAVQAALLQLSGAVTILVIAHQAETISHADQIAFLDHGRVVALGTHQELLAREPRYAAFWQRRTGADRWRITSRPATGTRASRNNHNRTGEQQ